MKNKFTLMLAIVASLGLSGCWESADVTLHEAGKYMGAKDPLLATSGASRAEGLQKRFQLVQVDR
ncbi:MAG: hypothetical protein ACI9DC_005096 [Gammaproteobacteria bacterium]|jgi:hypothetical protein